MMGLLVSHRCVSLIRRISILRSHGNCGGSELGGGMRMMMSTGVSPSKRKSPWLMLPPAIEEGGDMVYKFYNLSEEKEERFSRRRRSAGEEMPDDDAKFVGSSHGWLALLNQRSNNHLFLFNPITRRHIKLPPIETLPDPSINLTPDGRASVWKLILSSSPDDDDECIAMMSFGPEHRLAFCQPCRSSSSSTTEWTPVGDVYLGSTKGMFPFPNPDFAYSSRNKLFFVASGCDVECWDLSDPTYPRSHWTWVFGCTDLKGQFEHEEKLLRSEAWPDVKRQVSLVFSEEKNQLYFVMKYVMARVGPNCSYVSPIYFGEYRGWDNSFPYRTIGLEVYKLSFDVEKPVYMGEGSLDGLAMFIGMNHSFAMSPTPPHLRPNCIYYTDSNEFPIPPTSFYGGHDIGIFDYASRTFSPCYNYPLDPQSIKKLRQHLCGSLRV